jgi:hypothetical protein
VPLYLSFDSLSCPQYFALQIKTSTFLWVVEVEESLESLCDSLHFNVSHLTRPDIQDLAGFIHGNVRSREGAPTTATLLVCSGILLCGSCLAIGFGDCAAYYSGAGEDDLCDDAVGLAVLDGVYERMRRPDDAPLRCGYNSVETQCQAQVSGGGARLRLSTEVASD